MRNETKAIIVISALLLISIILNTYLLSGSSDYTEQIRLYKQLSEQFDTTEGLLQGRIKQAEKDLDTARVISDQLRENIRTLEETNRRRDELDTVTEELDGRTRAVIIEGITRIDSSSVRLEELERIETEARQALGGLLQGE